MKPLRWVTDDFATETTLPLLKTPMRSCQRFLTKSNLPTIPRRLVLNNVSSTATMLVVLSMARNAVSPSLHALILALTQDEGCGDVENILVASAPSTSTDPDDTQTYTRSAQPQIVADSECNSVCSGDGRYLCGSGNLLTYYAWSGTDPLYTWHFPTGAAAGEVCVLC